LKGIWNHGIHGISWEYGEYPNMNSFHHEKIGKYSIFMVEYGNHRE